MSYIDKIVSITKSYKGEEEKQPNLGFKSPIIDKDMRAIGFYNGASWCGFAVMLTLFKAYADNPKWLRLLKRYCSASTHLMWINFKASPEFITGQIPKVGAIAIWQDGNGTNGHTGIVISTTDSKHFVSSEGNSNSDGSRNGYEWSENAHIAGLPHKDNGLNLLGFVYLPEV